jgi:hypothetical protein
MVFFTSSQSYTYLNNNNFLVVSYHEKSLLSLGLSQVKKGVLLFYYLIRSDEESGGGVRIQNGDIW